MRLSYLNSQFEIFSMKSMNIGLFEAIFLMILNISKNCMWLCGTSFFSPRKITAIGFSGSHQRKCENSNAHTNLISVGFLVD